MLERILNPKIVFRLLIVAVLLRGALYTFVVPPWQHPDEPTHFEHVRLIADLGKPPEIEDISIPLRREIAISMAGHGFWNPNPAPEITDENLANPGTSLIGIYTLTHPRLYYRLASLWLRPWLGLSIEGQLFAVRLLGVSLNLVIALAAFKIAQMLFDSSRWIAPVAMAFVVFHPGNTDIMSAVNNDVLVNAIGALFFFTLALIYKQGASLLKVLALLLLLIAGFLTKTTALILLATLPFALMFYLLLKGRSLLAISLIVSIVTAALGLFVFLQAKGLEGLPEGILADIGSYFRVNISQTVEGIADPAYARQATQALPVVFKSFWAAFGWRHIWLAPIWYWIIGGICTIAGAGIIKRFLRWLSEKRWREPVPAHAAYLGFAFFAVLVASVIAVLRSLAAQGLRPYLSHGRYAFIAMIPIAILFIIGIRSWIRVPESNRANAAFIAGLFTLDAIAFWGYLVPFYY
ncbi:MAG: hypothetical protein IIC78_14925 [Chloroflexi bacterium]|nr:hypothetical protein [Chloroflexota bacterium]